MRRESLREGAKLLERSFLDEIKPPRHGGRVEEVAEEVGLDPEDMVDFSANLNPLAPPTGVKDSVKEALNALTRYPDDRYPDFRKAVLEFLEGLHGLRLAPDNLVPGNGSLEIIRILINYVHSQGGKSVIVPVPTFSEYEHQAQIFGLKTKKIPYGDFLDLETSQLSQHDLAFFCNPNNPTGELVSKEELKTFANKCQEANTVLAIDEAFIELSDPTCSAIELIPTSTDLVIFRSLTKNFSIPGVRIGFGVASKSLSKKLDKLRPNWNINVFAVELTKQVLKKGGSFLSRSREYIEMQRSRLSRELTELGFEVYPGRANFLLMKTSKTGLTAPELTEEAARKGVILRNAESFDGLDERYLRIAVKRKGQNHELIKLLKALVKNQ